MARKKLPQERRKWQRLPLAVPVFIRCTDKAGKETLEFATAVNVSAGGMLLAVRRMLPACEEYFLEIPSAPMPDSEILSKSSRKLRAQAVRVVHAQDHHLLGLRFSRSLLT